METLVLRARIGVLEGKGRSTGGRLEISGFGACELDNPKEKTACAAAPFLPFLDSRTQATSGRPEHSRTLPVRAGPSSEATLTVADWPENRIHVLLNCPSPSQPRSPLLYSPSPLGRRRRLACSPKSETGQRRVTNGQQYSHHQHSPCAFNKLFVASTPEHQDPSDSGLNYSPVPRSAPSSPCFG